MLLDLPFISVSVRMVLQSHLLVCLFDLLVGGSFLDTENSIVVLFLGFSLLLFSQGYFVFEIDRRVQLLDFCVVRDSL